MIKSEPIESPSLWTIRQGPGPVLATAIHDGHELRADAAAAMKLQDADRLREEDPFTGEAVRGVPTHVVAHRSRFEFDLNRGADLACYRTPEQSWGLEVWKDGEPSDELVEGSLLLHGEYYRMLGALLDGILQRHDRFVLLDVHSYNHRRDGPDAAPMAQSESPDVNIGTFSMPRESWSFLVDPLMEWMSAYDFNGRRLDVRENVAFQGKGEQARFVHERYPGRGCAIAIEFKKFYMDEWTGAANVAEVTEMRRFIGDTAKIAATMLER